MKNFGVEKFKRLLVVGSFSVVVEFLMGLSDSIVAGNLLGEEALAAINLLAPVMNGVTFFAALCGVGMGVNYAFESGSCHVKRAHEFFTQGLWTVLIGGVFLFALGIFLREPFLAFMDPGPAVAEPARAYWTYFLFSVPLEPVVVLFVNAAMADGDTRLCMTSYLVQLSVNLVVLILTIRWLGAGGCALGTSVANACALGVLSTHFLRKSNSFRLLRHFDLRDTLRIWKSSFGDASSFLCSAGLFFVLNKFVIAHFTGAMLPVLSTVIVTIGFLEVFNGVGNALAPVVTVYVGERNTRAVRLMMNVAEKLAVGEGVLLAVLLAAFPQLVTRMVGVDDPALALEANWAVRIVSGGLVFYALVYLFNSYYVFIAREGLAMAITVVSGFVSPVALVFLFGGAGMKALAACLALAPAAAMAGFSVFLVLRHGRKAFPLLISRARDAKITMFDLPLEETRIVKASEEVSRILTAARVPASTCLRAALMTEEVLMAVKDRNAGRKVLAEVTLDLNDGVVLTLRDDGEIFDITDADQRVSSLRAFLVASVMERQKARMNILTTGFNRNVFRF